MTVKRRRKSNNSEKKKMRISFDLDEVLFVSPMTHKTEEALRFPFNKIYKERLRLGTPELINSLKQQGFEIWVYTSSFRSERYIKWLFKHYGVKFDGIINGERHLREVQRDRQRPMPNKMPSYYRIALHIDDEQSVVNSSKDYGVKILKVDVQDDEWAEKITATAYEVKKKEEMQGKL